MDDGYTNMCPIKHPLLIDNGLNIQAIFNLPDLPEEIITAITSKASDISHFKQLIVFGHGGKQMWEKTQQSTFAKLADPIDNFSSDIVRHYFASACNDNTYTILYPNGADTIPLQKLGELVGWHHAAPFKVGINAFWGSWFAYRVVVLADTSLEPTPHITAPSPCDSCKEKACISACPASAFNETDASFETCVNYRLSTSSPCKTQCLARLACPIASEHRYTTEQINYHYTRSMQTIEEYST